MFEEVILFGILLILSIAFSGLFLWISLRIIGKRRGLLEAGIANLAAGILAFAVLGLLGFIPFFAVISPVVGYFAYLWALKVFLRINLFEAFLASILASVVFFILAMLIKLFVGIWFFKFGMFPGRFHRILF
jgi:hypothetical protein